MFKSFFPRPALFFSSALIWMLLTILFWQLGGERWLNHIVGASEQVPIRAARFWAAR